MANTFTLGASADVAGAGTVVFTFGTISVGGTYNVTGASTFSGAIVNFNAPIASLGLVPVGLGWIFVNPANPWLGYVLSAAGAALWAGVEVANFNFVLEFSGSEEDDSGSRGGSNYVAVNSVIINIAGCLGGLSAGIIAQVLREWKWEHGIAFMQTFTFYEVLFVLSGVLRLVAVVAFIPLIHEPAARPARETLVYMTANIYNNLASAALQPLRFARLIKKATYRQP